MNFTIYLTLLLVLVASFLSDHRVTGKCGNSIADTPWAACLVAQEGGVCPHNFMKLEDDNACAPRGIRTSKRVCCLLVPVIDLKVKDSPCLAGTPSSDEVEKKTHKHH